MMQAAQYQQQMQWAQFHAQQAHAHAAAQYQHQQLMMRQGEERRRADGKRKQETMDEEQRKAQEQSQKDAADKIMAVIQKVRIATPETIDSCKRELDDAFTNELKNAGNQAQTLILEKEKA